MVSDPRTPDTIFLHWNGRQTIWREGRWGHDDVEYVRVDKQAGIIAAPLAACKAALSLLVLHGPAGEKEAMQHLRTAIAKAEGKEEQDA